MNLVINIRIQTCLWHVDERVVLVVDVAHPALGEWASDLGNILGEAVHGIVGRGRRSLLREVGGTKGREGPTEPLRQRFGEDSIFIAKE